MIAMKEKRSLFGGALRCAGLAAAATMTNSAFAEFTAVSGPAVPNYTFNYTVDAAGGTPIFAYDLNYTGFPGDTVNITSYVGLVAYSNPGAMGAIANAYLGADQYSYVGAVVWQYFTVETAKRGTVYWDLAAANQYAFVYVYQFGVGALLNEVAGSVGSQHFTLTAGETYAFIARASMSNPADGASVYGVMIWEVPAPGALALLGISMVGTRRRRRE